MKKLHFNQLCEEYKINPEALKECMKKEDLKRKTATTQDVLIVIYLYCSDLMWCRGAGDGTIEYHNPKITERLMQHMTLVREFSK